MTEKSRLGCVWSIVDLIAMLTYLLATPAVDPRHQTSRPFALNPQEVTLWKNLDRHRQLHELPRATSVKPPGLKVIFHFRIANYCSTSSHETNPLRPTCVGRTLPTPLARCPGDLLPLHRCWGHRPHVAPRPSASLYGARPSCFQHAPPSPHRLLPPPKSLALMASGYSA